MRWAVRPWLVALVCVGAGLRVASAESAASRRDLCVRSAAAHYYTAGDPIPYPALVDLIKAVMAQEAGCGKVATNTDGSVDIGCMQINSSHLSTLARFGIRYDMLRDNECQNIFVGTWILHSEIRSAPDLWTGVGNYNTGAGRRTEKRIRANRTYQANVWRRLQALWAASAVAAGG